MELVIALGVTALLSWLWMRAIDKELDKEAARKKRAAEKAEFERLYGELLNDWALNLNRQIAEEQIRARQFADAYGPRPKNGMHR